MASRSLEKKEAKLLEEIRRHTEMHSHLVWRYSFAEAIVYESKAHDHFLNDYLHFCYAKSARTFDAMRVLLNEGFREDVFTLLRSSYENYLSFWYVFKNEESLYAFVDAKVGKSVGDFVHPKAGAARHLKVIYPPTGKEYEYGRPISVLAREGSPRIRVEFHTPFYEYLCEYAHNHFIALGGYLAPGLSGKFTAERPGITIEAATYTLLLSCLWLECMPLFEDLDATDLTAIRRLSKSGRSAIEKSASVLGGEEKYEIMLSEVLRITQELGKSVAL